MCVMVSGAQGSFLSHLHTYEKRKSVLTAIFLTKTYCPEVPEQEEEIMLFWTPCQKYTLISTYSSRKLEECPFSQEYECDYKLN